MYCNVVMEPPPHPPLLPPCRRVLLSVQSIVNAIDSRDEDGWTPLHAAIYWENMDAAKLLVQKGASVNAVTKTVKGWDLGRNVLMRSSVCCLCYQGDTIDDLCRPEDDDQLEELKQLCVVRKGSRFTNDERSVSVYLFPSEY